MLDYDLARMNYLAPPLLSYRCARHRTLLIFVLSNCKHQSETMLSRGSVAAQSSVAVGSGGSQSGLQAGVVQSQSHVYCGAADILNKRTVQAGDAVATESRFSRDGRVVQAGLICQSQSHVSRGSVALRSLRCIIFSKWWHSLTYLTDWRQTCNSRDLFIRSAVCLATSPLQLGRGTQEHLHKRMRAPIYQQLTADTLANLFEVHSDTHFPQNRATLHRLECMFVDRVRSRDSRKKEFWNRWPSDQNVLSPWILDRRFEKIVGYSRLLKAAPS